MKFRDPADQLGAAIGCVIGIFLVVMISLSHAWTGLILNGVVFPNTLCVKIVAYLLVVGICINLIRNLFVGMHDACVFLFFLLSKIKKLS